MPQKLFASSSNFLHIFKLVRWRWITVASVVPMGFVFFTYNILPESPRWLITTGRLVEAEATLRKIAKVNKATVPDDLEARLKVMASKSKEKSYGYISLFSSFTMGVRTIAICVVFTSSAFIYYQLMINIGNMAGNTFLNMFLLGIVEGILSLYHRIIKPNLDLVMLIFRAWVPIGCVCG